MYEGLELFLLGILVALFVAACVAAIRAKKKREQLERDAKARERLIAEIEADNAKARARAQDKRFSSGSYK